MGTMSVTTSPQQVQTSDASREEITILNDGPSTVYLGGNSGISASPYNSYRLTPFATMTWKRGRDLWARTAIPPEFSFAGQADGGYNPTSSLVVNGDGNLSIANTDNGRRILAQGTFPVSATDDTPIINLVETGPYSTLLVVLNMQAPTLAFLNDTTFVDVRTSWYNENGSNYGYPDTRSKMWTPRGTTAFTLPTKNSYALVSIVPIKSGGLVTAYGNYYLIGSMQNAAREIAVMSDPAIPQTGTSPTRVTQGNSFKVTNYDLSAGINSRLYLSGNSTRLRICTQNIGAIGAGSILAIMDNNGVVVELFTPTSSVGGGITVATLELATDRACYIQAFGSGIVNLACAFV